MYDNQILKNYMKDKKYNECITILKNKIISYVIDKIKIIDSSIKFTTVSDLIYISDFYLNNSSIAINLQNALTQETELEQIEYLLSICEENSIF